MTIDICVQHGGPEAPRCIDLSAAVETCFHMICFLLHVTVPLVHRMASVNVLKVLMSAVIINVY